ncbi:MAG: hypothetical protein R3F11_19910 [Verrucomicrobiales bacterium]
MASITQWRSATEAHLFYDPPEPTGFAEKHTGSWGDFQATPAPDGRFDLRGDFEWSARLGDSPSAEKPFRQPAIFSAREALRWPEFAGGWALIGVYDPPPWECRCRGAPDRCLAALMHAGAIGYPEAFPARQESGLDPFAPIPIRPPRRSSPGWSSSKSRFPPPRPSRCSTAGRAGMPMPRRFAKISMR